MCVVTKPCCPIVTLDSESDFIWVVQRYWLIIIFQHLPTTDDDDNGKNQNRSRIAAAQKADAVKQRCQFLLNRRFVRRAPVMGLLSSGAHVTFTMFTSIMLGAENEKNYFKKEYSNFFIQQVGGPLEVITFVVYEYFTF